MWLPIYLISADFVFTQKSNASQFRRFLPLLLMVLLDKPPYGDVGMVIAGRTSLPEC